MAVIAFAGITVFLVNAYILDHSGLFFIFSENSGRGDAEKTEGK